jgi:hypothetical protein
MCILSIHGKLHLYKYANHLSSKVQNFFHQPSSRNVIRISINKPLHNQQGTHSITKPKSIASLPWITNHQKHITASKQKEPNAKKNKRI